MCGCMCAEEREREKGKKAFVFGVSPRMSMLFGDLCKARL